MIRAREYVSFLRREYLGDFVASGGAAVKFVVPQDDESAEELRGLLLSAGREEGYEIASVDAAAVRVHMIDRVFHEVARQIDWDARARSFVSSAIEGLGFARPEGDLSLERVAAVNAYDPRELRLELNRRLQEELLRDYGLAQEFRIAMVRLCQAQVDASDPVQADREAVLAWLRGELRLIGSLKHVAIFQKIARHNARDMLLSLARWLPRSGRTGLLLELDIRRCAVPKRPPEDASVFYTKAAVLDVYELLRQLIDATDELSSCLVFVTVAPELLTDPKRGIEHSYHALKLRIWDEVRDRRRTNPLAALVRVSKGAEALIVHR